MSSTSTPKQRGGWRAAMFALLGASILTVSAPAVAAGQTPSTTDAHCPADAPVGGRYLHSYLSAGHYFDVYLVPFHDGWKQTEITCG
ncbi:hypothetical protein [Actinokineospora enzanensis]|uniref:hypothetical protein n=1 Tax=Actinokineospora enzanensis TaxID=155975 RepID=UPI00036AC543|nr:hypothetical protein [Actinokineospora enzanensis]